jgi:hypothetical protein
MRINEIYSDDIEYTPIKLKMGKYRNPFDPRTGEHNTAFKDDLHIPNLELADDVDELIDSGQEPEVTIVNINDLHASQDWLSNVGSGEDTFPDYYDLPVVLQIGNELNIVDGHHRISKLANAGKQQARVYLFQK